MSEIENLVFEGGGVRGIAFTGAIQCLEEKGILKNVKRFAGSSAGALAATMLALNYNASEFKYLRCWPNIYRKINVFTTFTEECGRNLNQISFPEKF